MDSETDLCSPRTFPVRTQVFRSILSGAGDETEAAGAARTTIAAAMATIMDSLESIVG